MTSTEDRLEFAPPRDKASPRALGLALLVHVLLIAALTWGVNWKRTDEAASFEAELWSGVPQPAAPPPIQAPLPPAPEPAPAPEPPPAPPVPPVPAPAPRPAPPVVKAPEVKETPPLPDVDIALEKEKKRKLLQQQKEAEVLKAEKLQEKREAELQARQAKEQERKKEKEQQAREALAERKAREVAEKAEAKKQEVRQLANEKEKEKEKEKRTATANAAAAAEKQKQAAAEKQKAATAAANAEKQKEAAAAAADAKQKAAAAGAEKARQAAIQKRIMDMAGVGSLDGSSGAGTAKANGPSAGYAGKVRAKVLPNVVFNDDLAGNPVAEVTVTTTADGTIMSQKLSKSSGSKAWDDAVIKAIVRTGSLPRDTDGRVPTPMIIEFRPN